MSDRTCFLRGYRVTLIALALLTPLSQARAAEPAASFPAETVALVAWSGGLDAEQERTVRGMAEQFAALADAPPEDRAALNKVLDPLMLAAGGPGGVALVRVGDDPEQMPLVFAGVFDLGVRSSTLMRQLEQLAAEGAEFAPMPVEIAGAKFKQARPEDEIQLVWGLHRDRFYLLLGGAATTAVAEEMLGGGPTLAGDPLYKRVRAKLKTQHAPAFVAYANVKRGVAAIKRVAHASGEKLPPQFDQVVAESGLGSIEAAIYVLDWGETATGEVYLAFDGPRTGLLKLWQHEALTQDDLAVIPHDATIALAANMNLAAWWDETMRILDLFAPDQTAEMQAGIEMVNGVLGFSIARQLLPALSGTWVLFDAPSHGSFFYCNSVLAIESPDPNGLQAVGARLVQLAAPFAKQENISISPRRVEHEGHVIDYVTIGGAPVPFAPAACVVDGRLALALSPQPLMVAMQQLDPQRRSGSLLDRPDVQAAMKSLPDKLQSLYYGDTAAALRNWYGFVHGLSVVFYSLGGDAAPPIHELPTLPQMLERATPSLMGCSVDEGGVHYVEHGSGGLAGPPALSAAGIAAAAALPSFGRAREEARAAVSASNLRGIGVACIMYANDHDNRLPPDLQTLIDEGLITAKLLQSPLKDEDETSYCYLGGGRALRDFEPQMILAYERLADARGMAVFADVHVEQMDALEFERALNRTTAELEQRDAATD